MMAIMTVVCTVVWQNCITDELYNCTDPGWLDYLSPGDWVHFDHGVIYVPHIVTGRSMSDPDTIKEGWSVNRLWCLWLAFFAVSLFVSAGFTFLPWMPKRNSAANGTEN